MSQEEYLREYEKYKHIKIEPGLYKKGSIQFEILEVDKNNETAVVMTVKSGMTRSRTLHWCRKYLEKA